MLKFAKILVTSRGCTRRIRFGGGAIALLLAIVQIAPASAQVDDTLHSPEEDTIRRMNLQILELQAKVRELEIKFSAISASATAPATDTSAPVSTTSAVMAPSTTAQSMPPPQESQGEVAGVKLRMFGDVGYEVGDRKGETNSFHIGSMDLLMTGTLSDRVSVLGEVLFTPLEDNSFGVDVERLLLQYKHNDYLAFSIGRYHSSIGYYNTAFHQGAWFQTAIDRPFMYAFDDAGGFLPLQEVGATISGQIPSGNLGLNYVLEMGNGRAHLLGSDPAQNTQDTNNGKSVNFAFYGRPRWIPGLQAGFSLYHDYLTFSDNINHSELISTVHFVFTNSDYEFLNEAMLVRHTLTKTGAPGLFHTPGFYSQFSRRFGKYRPYFRYSFVNAGVAEPIYGDPDDGPLVGRRNGPTLGLRYDLNHVAWKLQYDHLAQRGEKSFNALETQLSFAF